MDRDHDASRRLAVCPDCHRNYVVPLDGVERDGRTWWLELRCGWCGAYRTLVATHEEAGALCDEVEVGLERLSAIADRLRRERHEVEIATFAAALRLDLISSEDFGR